MHFVCTGTTPLTLAFALKMCVLRTGNTIERSRTCAWTVRETVIHDSTATNLHPNYNLTSEDKFV